MSYNGCIFDLDGVIVDTAKYHYLAWKRLADELGIPFHENDNEKLKGVSRMQSLQKILDMGGVSMEPEEMDRLATTKNEWFLEYLHQMGQDEILPGASEFLEDLERNGIKKAIGSASKNARLALERVNLLNRFDAVVDGTMVHEAKPSPEVFLKASSLLGLEAEQCIVFEDAYAGVEAAYNGGMKCIGIGNPKVLTNAESVLPSLEGIHWKKILQLVE